MSKAPAPGLRLASVLAALVGLCLLAWLWSREPAGRAPSVADPAQPVENSPPSERAAEIEVGQRQTLAEPPEPASAASEEDGAAAAGAQATLLARSVDVSGAVSKHATYLALPIERTGAPRARRQWREGVTDDQGRMRLEGLEPGRWILVLSATYRAPQSFDLWLPPGVTDLGDVRFALEQPGHDLIVRLAAGEAPHDKPSGYLHVRSLAGDQVDRWNFIGRIEWMRSDFGQELSFTFRGLPAGRYELTFQRRDILEPTARRELELPCEPVSFELAGGVLPLRVIARGAQGAPVPAKFLLGVSGWAAHAELAVAAGDGIVGLDPGGPFRWVLLAPGFEPLQGTQADFRLGAGELRLECELRAGWGTLVIARDYDRLIDVPTCGGEIDMARSYLPGLAGLEVAVDGRTVVRTDHDGIALVLLARREALIEFVGARHVPVETLNLADQRIEDFDDPVLVRCASVR